uniref:Protein E6 n=1 Tax=Bat papillomavirus TaxID=2004707 RepID=A0A2Z2JMV2_9PAPI|nr:E6 [Bat papillomavirus]
MPSRPNTLSGVAEAEGRTIAEISVSCYFCRDYLTVKEKYNYQLSGLLLIYSNNVPYASCYECIREACIEQHAVNFDRFLSVIEIEEEDEQPIVAILVRCGLCLKPLNFAEKEYHKIRDIPMFTVKGGWKRGICTKCILTEI